MAKNPLPKKEVNSTNVLEALHKPLAAIGTYNEKGELMMTGRQAMFYAFQTLACGIDWQSEESFVVEASEQISDGLEKFSKIEEGKKVSKKYVDEYITELKRATRHHLLRQSSDYLLQNYGYDDRITTEDFYKIHENLNFPQVDVNADYIRVWQARTMFIWATIRTFFSFYEEEVAMKLLDELAFKTPPTERERQLKTLKNMLKGLFKCDREDFIMVTNIPVHSDPSLESTLNSAIKNHEHQEVASTGSLSQSTSNCKTKESKMQELKSNEKDPKVIYQSTSTKSQVKVEVVKKENVPEPSTGCESKCEHQLKPPQKKIAESLEKLSILKSEQAQSKLSDDSKQEEVELKPAEACQKVDNSLNSEPKPVPHNSKPENLKLKSTKTPSRDTKPAQSESKLCDKCTRNGQKLLEAQSELQTAVNKANKYEEKAKKTTQMEKDMKKIRKENDELKKELEKIKTELKNGKEKEEKSKVTIEKLSEKVEDLEIQVKREQQRVIVGQQENAQLRQRVDGIQLKFAINQSKVEEELAKKDLLICKLRKMHSDKFSMTSFSSKCSESKEEEEEPKSSGSSKPYTSNSEETGKSPRWHLIKWQKIKDKINMDQVLNEQKDMIERLISVTQDREVKNLAEYEQTRFEGTKNIYLQIVEMNIQKIKKTDDFSNLLPIPDYPKLSSEFLAKFTEEMKNQPEVSEVGLSPETNCYICFEPYVEKDVKKICKECNKPVHLECDNIWRSKQKDQNIPDDDTCGFCRGEMEENKGGKKEKNK